MLGWPAYICALGDLETKADLKFALATAQPVVGVSLRFPPGSVPAGKSPSQGRTFTVCHVCGGVLIVCFAEGRWLGGGFARGAEPGCMFLGGIPETPKAASPGEEASHLPAFGEAEVEIAGEAAEDSERQARLRIRLQLLRRPFRGRLGRLGWTPLEPPPAEMQTLGLRLASKPLLPAVPPTLCGDPLCRP